MKKQTIAYRENENHREIAPQLAERLQRDGYEVITKSFPKGTKLEQIREALQGGLEGAIIADSTVEKYIPGRSADINLDQLYTKHGVREGLDEELPEKRIYTQVFQREAISNTSENFMMCAHTAAIEALEIVAERYSEPLELLFKTDKPDGVYIVNNRLIDYEEGMQKIFQEEERVLRERPSLKRYMEKNNINPKFSENPGDWLKKWVNQTEYVGEVRVVESALDIPQEDLQPDSNALVLAHHHEVYEYSRSEDPLTKEHGKKIEAKYIDIGDFRNEVEKRCGTKITRKIDIDAMYLDVKSQLKNTVS
jgi:hypothetical protein